MAAWVCLFFGLFLSPLFAQEPPRLINRIAVLDQSFQAFHAGKPRLARAQLLSLLQTSPDAGDEAYLLSLGDQMLREKPFYLDGGLGLSPSTNIDRASRYDRFDTLIGPISLENGGNPRFGLQSWVWAEAGAGVVVASGTDVTVKARLGRNLFPNPVNNRSDATLGVKLESWRAAGRASLAMEMTGQRFEKHPLGEGNSDALLTRFNASFSRNLPGLQVLSVDFQHGWGLYQDAPLQNGSASEIRFSWGAPLGQNGTIKLSTKLGRADPSGPHLKNGSAAVGLDLALPVSPTGFLGLSADLAGAAYDNPYLFVDYPRNDGSLTLGVRLQDVRLKLFGQVPSLNCAWTQNRSTIALFATEAVDCHLSLTARF